MKIVKFVLEGTQEEFVDMVLKCNGGATYDACCACIFNEDGVDCPGIGHLAEFRQVEGEKRV